MTQAPTSTGRIGRRRVVWAPFGRHTWYLLAGYLRHIFMVCSILLAIALTIDLWPQFQDVASRGTDGLSATWSVMRFALLRTPGVIAPLLPFATFIGVVWTEVAHTQSGERMLVWNSGRSPAQCLAPVLALGAILGVTDFVLDGYLGPASMHIQMRERLGRDGARLDRGQLSKEAWIATSGGLLKASIEYGPPPVLHDVIFFQRDPDGRILEVVAAPRAILEPGSDRWHLADGQYWTTSSPQLGRSFVFGNASRQIMTPFKTRVVRLKLDPLWLSWYDLVPQYIPPPVLARLAQSREIPDAHGQYATRLNVVYAENVLPGAFALLAATLCMFFLAYRVSAVATIGILFSGYAAHFATKACLIMGQNGYMPPFLAGWLVPASLLATTGVVFAMIERQRRKSVSAD